jgi:hypothetical protein
MLKNKELLISYLSLFTSTGTIFCCALPSLLVAIGMGASFAGLVGAFPQIVWLSENKMIVFTLSGLMILLSAFITYSNRNAPCPIDPKKALACKYSRMWSIRLLFFSGLIWIVGFSFAFVAPLIFF